MMINKEDFVILKTLPAKAGRKKKDNNPGVTYDKKNGLYFQINAIRAINSVDDAPVQYVCLRVNEKTKQLSIEPTTVDDPGARAFMHNKDKEKNIIIRWSDALLMSAMERMLPDKTIDRVLIPMKYDADSGWFVINIEEATKSKRKRGEK